MFILLHPIWYLIMKCKQHNAAKRGIDVRIITPHIPDKWYVHAVTKSNYQILIESGVKYTNIFRGLYGKTFTVDDKFATVGTINLDYRSLYLHFECGVWLYQYAQCV